MSQEQYANSHRLQRTHHVSEMVLSPTSAKVGPIFGCWQSHSRETNIHLNRKSPTGIPTWPLFKLICPKYQEKTPVFAFILYDVFHRLYTFVALFQHCACSPMRHHGERIEVCGSSRRVILPNPECVEPLFSNSRRLQCVRHVTVWEKPYLGIALSCVASDVYCPCMHIHSWCRCCFNHIQLRDENNE